MRNVEQSVKEVVSSVFSSVESAMLNKANLSQTQKDTVEQYETKKQRLEQLLELQEKARKEAIDALNKEFNAERDKIKGAIAEIREELQKDLGIEAHKIDPLKAADYGAKKALGFIGNLTRNTSAYIKNGLNSK